MIFGVRCWASGRRRGTQDGAWGNGKDAIAYISYNAGARPPSQLEPGVRPRDRCGSQPSAPSYCGLESIRRGVPLCLQPSQRPLLLVSSPSHQEQQPIEAPDSTKEESESWRYRCKPFEAPPPVLGEAGEQALKGYHEHHLSPRHMVTLCPLPSNITRNPEVMENRLHKCLVDYEKATGKKLRHAGWITRGKNGRKRCELHFGVPRGHHVDWRALKACLRKRFDCVVTGEYAADEEVPANPKKRNSPPHDIVLEYLASHADHPNAHVLWSLGGKRKQKRKRRRRSRRLQAPAGMKPLFSLASVFDEDEDDL